MKDKLYEEIERYFRSHDELSLESFEIDVRAIYERIQDEKIVPYKPIEVNISKPSDTYDTEVTHTDTHSIADVTLEKSENFI